MITDKLWYFQDDVGTAGDDISATTTAEISSQIMDLRKVYGTVDRAGEGYADGDVDLVFYARCKTLGTSTIETIQLKDSADGSTFVAFQTTAVPQASVLAGTTILRTRLPPGLRRFIRISFTNTTSGTNVFNAWIAPS